jgi:hypothetical protein
LHCSDFTDWDLFSWPINHTWLIALM